MADFGRDLSGVRDLDYSLSEVGTNTRLGVAQAIARRLMTPFLFYDEDYGYDLRQFLNASIDDPGSIEAGIENEALKDERVVAATAQVRFIHATETMFVGVHIKLDELSEFEMTLSVNQLTVELLSVGGA